MDRWMYPFSPFLSTISTYTLVDRFPNTKCMITEIPSIQWSENAVLHRPVSFFFSTTELELDRSSKGG